MIRQVTIRNFKQFGEQTFELSESVMLAGHNNSGKTTLLQAIAVWKLGLDEWLASKSDATVSDRRTAVTITRQNFTALHLREMNLMWTNRCQGAGNRNKVEICVTGETEGQQWSCGLEFIYAGPESVYVRPQNLSELTPAEISQFPPQPAKDLNVVFGTAMSGVRWDEPRYQVGFQNLRLAQGCAGEILKNLMFELAQDESSWRDFSHYLAELFEIEVHQPIYYDTNPYIDCEYSHISPTKSSRPLDLSSIGSGAQQVMLLLALLYARSASVILLDEPAAHLNVMLQSPVYDTLRCIADERQAQLVIATHSETLLEHNPDRVLQL